MTQLRTLLDKRDALIVVDMQKDFLPGGALAVVDGDAMRPIDVRPGDGAAALESLRSRGARSLVFDSLS